MDDLSVATLEPEEYDLRKNIISNISVPETSGKRVMNVDGNSFNQVQPGGDVMPKLSNPIPTISLGRPYRRRIQPTRMNISSNKRNRKGAKRRKVGYFQNIEIVREEKKNTGNVTSDTSQI